MSRRKVSLKELGQVDCQGWLYKKKEGKGFLGTKWKKYWFVLKKISMYWYTGQTAEKAEGYIDLTHFTVDQATECKRKHAMKASHPQVVTLYFAAEKCYSEESDQEEVESLETSAVFHSEQLTIDSVNVSALSHSTALYGTSDEMEALYIHLKHARLSPTGELKRDFRASFIQRCKNDRVNEKLHLVRTLNSTLKAKEADLLAIEHVLADPILTAQRYRQWRAGNVVLLQEITRHKKGPPGGSREQSFPLEAPRTHCTAETSV
uniref:Interactor protein for cytohesin exchange factors 1-like n=1 Tax=Salmo trutta TaxID=8032 RepID=A0A674C391_SALTR